MLYLALERFEWSKSLCLAFPMPNTRITSSTYAYYRFYLEDSISLLLFTLVSDTYKVPLFPWLLSKV